MRSLEQYLNNDVIGIVCDYLKDTELFKRVMFELIEVYDIMDEFDNTVDDIRLEFLYNQLTAIFWRWEGVEKLTIK